MTRLSDSDLQRGFLLANAIHPDRAVALCVLWDACERVALLENLQRRRHGYKLHTPAEGQLQFSVYLASENWERDQESERPRKEPRYTPSTDDLIVRYVKALAKNSMDWHCQYGAVAIGSLLWQYAPHQISQLAEEVFKSDNIRRVKSTMSKLLKKRFAFMNGNGEVPFVIPSSHQRLLIHRALAIVAPWATCPDVVPSVSLLETHFASSSQKSEWERLHVLFHPACGGFPQLVNEYNSTFKKGNKMRLEEPEDKLGCPKFGTDFPLPPNDDINPPDRFNPSPLTREEISTIRHSVERNDKRRNEYRKSMLRVVVDGEETAKFAHNIRPEPFAIPSTASCIEIFGDDEEGDLLLAVFPLSPEETDNNTFEQQVCVEAGQRIELSISLAPKCDSEKSDKIAYNWVWVRYTALSGLPIGPSERDSGVEKSFVRVPPVLIVGAGGITSHYLIERLLGCRDVGELYLAQDDRKNAPVVINIIDSSSEERETTKRLTRSFLKEINILKHLDHPNLARVYDVGRLFDGRQYVVMESVLGVSLRTKIDSDGMELSGVINIIRQLSEAIGTLHDHSILHCDIKPENILVEDVEDTMHVKLCDFGLMRQCNSDVLPTKTGATHGRTASIPPVGSATYMAPELFMGEVSSVQSDIYALGALLYEMVTGTVPFSAESSAELLELKRSSSPNPCDLRPDLPEEAREVISRALMANPRDRFARARELGDAIAGVLSRGNKIKRENTVIRSSWRTGSSSIVPRPSQVGLVQVLQDIIFKNRAVEDLIMHENFGVRLRKICYTFRDPGISPEELYQEVCLKLLVSTKGLTPDNVRSEREFFRWLHVLTRNAFFNTRRAKVGLVESSGHYDPISTVEPEHSDNWAEVVKMEASIFCKEIIDRLPLSVIFGHLTEEEKVLARLIYLEEMSTTEIANHLNQDRNRIARDVNKISNKIRMRVRTIVKGTPLEDILTSRTAPGKKDQRVTFVGKLWNS